MVNLLVTEGVCNP